MSEPLRQQRKIGIVKHKPLTVTVPETTIEALEEVYREINKQYPFATVNKRLVVNHILILGIEQWHKENPLA